MKYTDDTQIIIGMSGYSGKGETNFETCMEAIAGWMKHHFCNLNSNNTEILICVDDQLGPKIVFLQLLNIPPTLVNLVRNLGFYLDKLGCRSRISKLSFSCFGH